VACGFYAFGKIVNQFAPGVHNLGWMVLAVAVSTISGLIPDYILSACYSWFKFVAKAFVGIVLLSIGIVFTDLGEIAASITPHYVFMCATVVFGAVLGAGFVGRLVGFHFIEAAITAGLCMTDMGGTGDVAVLSAAKRMQLMPFARLSTSIGGALIIFLCGILASLHPHSPVTISQTNTPKPMPKFVANLTMLFTEAPFMERFALAAQAGFTHVEYLFPYPFKAEDLKAELDKHGLKQVLFNLPAGDWAGGERGIAALPGRSDEFRAGVPQAIEYAKVLGVNRVNCLVGKRSADHSDDEHRQTLIENIGFAATELAKHTASNWSIEPINHYDIPGFFINRTEHAIQLIDEVGHPNVRVQFDIYHVQREEGEITGTFRKYISTASATSRSRTTQAAISPAPARSIFRSSSARSTQAATQAGSASNTSPRPTPAHHSAG
jgi:hydroxypyruvate isomerase